MGGHGFYVWGSFGACVLFMIAEPILASGRQKGILRTLRRERIAEDLEKDTK
ncbi:MAG: heme exporter protein CcmD [Rhodocyclaceae bacterium]|nr:heme exporter protein CcmD [Rhodocyclaceae bacterium]MBK6554998.1 heme exporter protein CcmD [Rhodocyclaceae bacterium]MBK6677052.1 heme exporter protein CcmD [Rhodocyclaceae bacterium]MBK7815985.1 heme exporter protein CcmD [Rhodocyclaceae bacterium]MBK9309722.1 heme exporter protein CcmD [Rhodocyclaceae bacterium]